MGQRFLQRTSIWNRTLCLISQEQKRVMFSGTTAGQHQNNSYERHVKTPEPRGEEGWMPTPSSKPTSCIRWEEKWKGGEFVTPLGKCIQMVKRCRWRVAAEVPWHSPEFGTKEQPHMPPANAGGMEGHSHGILLE